MLLLFFRILFFVILILSIFFDFDIPIILNTQINQLLIAIIIIIIIIVIDEMIGFLLGCIFLVVYFKYYQKMINKNNATPSNNLNEPLLKAYTSFNVNEVDSFVGDVAPTKNRKIESTNNHYERFNNEENCIEMPYISNELLLKAQNNIYDETNYYTEIKNVENAYGIQGLNSDLVHYSAYDKTTIDDNYNENKNNQNRLNADVNLDVDINRR